MQQPIPVATADAIGVGVTNPDFCEACANGLPGFARRDVGVVQFIATPGDIPTEHVSLPVAGTVDTLKNKTAIDYVGYGVTFQAQIPGSQLPQPPPFYRWDGLGTRMFAQGETVSGNFKHSAEFMKLTMNAGGGSVELLRRLGRSEPPGRHRHRSRRQLVHAQLELHRSRLLTANRRSRRPTWVSSFVN